MTSATSPDDPRAPRLPRSVHFADRATPRRRRRKDLVDAIGSLIGIALVWMTGVFANATTQGVTEDVLRFRFVREVLLMPVTLVEGLVVLVAPIAIIVALALRRRLNAIIETVSTAVIAALIGWAALTAVSLLPPEITAPLRVAKAVAVQGDTTSTAIGINIVIVTLVALFTAAGEAANMRTVRWAWNGLWLVLVLGVLRGSMTLPSAFISILIGRAVGSAARWFVGFEDRRASGADLIEGLLSIGITPSRLVRTDLDTSDEPLTTWTISEDRRGRLRCRRREVGQIEYTVTQRPDPDGNRHYQAWDHAGAVLEIVVLDPGRELFGTLLDLWNNIRLRGISRWVSPSMKAAAERSALTVLAARRAGVRTPDFMGVAQAGDSLISVSRAMPPTVPLHDLSAESITDEMLDEAWAQLAAARTRGISHRALSFGSLVIDDESRVWILDWERGEVATTELNKRIDVAQMLVLLALCVGEERALESARRNVDARLLRSCAPVLQSPVLPFGVRQAVRRTDLVENLRTAIVGEGRSDVPQVANLQRFRPRTVVMATVFFLALVAVLGSLNFEEIVAAVTAADPVWMGIAIAFSTLTWVGGAIPLMALSPVELRFREALLAQIAASIVTIVAPAGVGPAAVNLRYLRKKKVDTVVAATTVTLQQLIQAGIIISLLLITMVLSGNKLSVQLPYGVILAVVGVVAVVVGATLSVPKLRRWIWAKVEPTWNQVYPRLLWFVGQPKRIWAVLGGNIVLNIGFLGCFWAGLTALGGHLDILPAALTYLASNSLGSVIPSPGGIGPVEAALTAGLQVAGVPLSIGLPAAVLYRLITFYGRVPFGWVAMKYLERKDLI